SLTAYGWLLLLQCKCLQQILKGMSRMKRKTPVYVAAMLVLVLALVITGCSGNNSGGTTTNNNSSTTTPSNSEGGSDEKPLEKVTFTYFNGAGAAKDINTNETTIGKILEDQTGV